MAKDDSRVMRLRAQKRILADSPLPGTYSLWDNHLIPEGISNTELTTASSNQFIDESGSGHGQSQQPWLQQNPVELLLTDCTTDHSDQSSLLPNGKFQRRQAQIPNACSSQRNIQPGQLKLQQGDQGQEEQGEQTNPDGTHPDEGQVGEKSNPENVQALRVKPYPSDLDLLNLFQFGRTRDPNEVCNAFVGQSVPICAPVQVPPQISPAEVVVPSRFWTKDDLCIRVIEEFWCCSLAREPDPDIIIDGDQPLSSPNRPPRFPAQRFPTAYPAAGWSCARSDDVRGFRI